MLNLLVRTYDTQWDLTEDKRYTLSPEAKNIVRTADRPIQITVLLEGNIPATFKGYRSYLDQYLSELKRQYNQLVIEYKNPNEGSNEEVAQYKRFLRSRGVSSLGREVSSKSEVSKSELFPYISVDDGRSIYFVDLLDGKRYNESEEEAILRSQLSFEFKLLEALRTVIQGRRPEVHVLGKSASLIAAGYNRDIRMKKNRFVASKGDILLERFDSIDAIIVIANDDLSLQDLMAVDQLALQGTPILWFVQKFDVSLDSIRITGAYLANHHELNIEDYLFRLGVRISPRLIMDIQCTSIPQVVGNQGGQPQTVLIPYPFHLNVLPHVTPEGYSLSKAPISMRYVSPIDTLRSLYKIHKEVLLASSEYTQLRNTPVSLGFEFLRVKPQEAEYQAGTQIVGVELSGEARTYFKGRTSTRDLTWMKEQGYHQDIDRGKIHQIVISDADWAIPQRTNTGKYTAVGYNVWDRQMYEGNTDLINKLLERVLYGHALLSLSGREMGVSVMDRVKWSQGKQGYTTLLVALPILLLVLLYVIFHYWRKRYYGSILS